MNLQLCKHYAIVPGLVWAVLSILWLWTHVNVRGIDVKMTAVRVPSDWLQHNAVIIICVEMISITTANQCSYDETSLNGPSEMRTTSVERTGQKAPIDFSIQLMYF